jgi:hypothetical protein
MVRDDWKHNDHYLGFRVRVTPVKLTYINTRHSLQQLVCCRESHILS